MQLLQMQTTFCNQEHYNDGRKDCAVVKPKLLALCKSEEC